MVEHTAENVEKLAEEIVELWDLETLINYAVVNVTNHFMEDEEAFQKEWNEIYGDPDENS